MTYCVRPDPVDIHYLDMHVRKNNQWKHAYLPDKQINVYQSNRQTYLYLLLEKKNPVVQEKKGFYGDQDSGVASGFGNLSFIAQKVFVWDGIKNAKMKKINETIL